MKVFNGAQKSAGWLAWRNTGLSASEAAVVLDQSPYKTIYQLWAEKTGRATAEDLSANPNVRRGVALEDKARQCCEALLGEAFLLPACGSSDAYPFLLASFDGLTEENVPVEMKCPSEKNYLAVVQDQEASEPYLLYYPQVQQQILVANATHGWLLFYSPSDNGEHQMFKVQRDDALIQRLIERGQWLWEQVIKDTAPPRDALRDIFLPTGEEAEQWKYHAVDARLYEQQIAQHQKALNALKAKQKEALAPMKAMMGEFSRAEFAGVSITRFERKGSVNLERLIQEENLSITLDDLETYRDKGASQYRVSITDKAMPRNVLDKDVQDQLADVPDGPIVSQYF